MNNNKWETVSNGYEEKTERLKVIGGWLVRTAVYTIKYGDNDFCTEEKCLASATTAFVPDAGHKWSI